MSNLDGEVKTTLAKLDINSRPSPRLRLDGSYTYSNRDNNTPVNTYDYVITDTILSPDPRQNRPYSFEQHLLRLKAGYRLPKDVDLSGGFDYEPDGRTYQQVTETKDKTLWAKLKLQPSEKVETSLKLSHANRDASAYNAAAYQNPSYPESGAIPGDPLMQAFEMADRTRDKVGFDLSYNTLEKLSLGFALDFYKDDYKNMVLGLTKASGFTSTPSLTYVFSEKLSASAYYTYDKLSSDQSGREWLTLPPSQHAVGRIGRQHDPDRRSDRQLEGDTQEAGSWRGCGLFRLHRQDSLRHHPPAGSRFHPHRHRLTRHLQAEG